eukprot:CAMPEP_0178907364 /NCGR_PEP_ID=MMETSP0786-20121207/7331_1 /TAXON_ID=186022 /ORGANISM="Thalassionema frauenfeldii, Strain CCMP 1798" /LENGTH=74 /DNA_ID=CAMNT_0020579157 /DNA_START=270 /DNA_END=491 /DNA_ORIENTATION=+
MDNKTTILESPKATDKGALSDIMMNDCDWKIKIYAVDFDAQSKVAKDKTQFSGEMNEEGSPHTGAGWITTMPSA